MLQVSTHNGSGISGSTELTLDYGVYDLTLPTTRDGGSFRGQQTLAKYLPTKRRAPQVDVEVTDAGGRPPTKAKAAQFPASPPKSATEVVALLPKAPAKAKAAEVPAAPPANAKSTQEVQAPPETASLAPAPSGQTLVGPPPKTAAATVAAAAVAEAAAPKKKAPAKAKEPVPKEAQPKFQPTASGSSASKMQAFDAMLAAEETKNVSPTQLQEASTTSEELLQPEGKPQLQAQLPPFTEAQQKEIEGAELTSVNAKENSRPKTQTQLTTMCLD